MLLQSEITQDTDEAPGAVEDSGGMYLNLALLGILLWSAYIRFLLPLNSPMPINDGGMHLVMIDDILKNGFALPRENSYNSMQIPFSYPPLSTYLCAFISHAIGVSPVDLLRFGPPFLSVLCVLAVFLLGRALHSSPWFAVWAAFLFSITPDSYIQAIKGGGISRGLGLFLSLLFVSSFLRVLKKASGLSIAVAALLLASSMLAHPEMAIFAVIGMCAAAFHDGVERWKISSIFKVSLAALLLTLPWLLIVLERYGPGPLFAASQSNIFPRDWAAYWTDIFFITPYSTADYRFILISGLALFGFFRSLAARRLFLPLWATAVYVLVFRGTPHVLVVPLSLLAAQTIFDFLRCVETAGDPARSDLYNRRLRQMLGSYLVIHGAVISYLPVRTDFIRFRSLGPAELQLASWVRHNTRPNSRFLIMPSAWWGDDSLLEFFPALTGRQSIMTCQGREWLPKGAFHRCIVSHDRLNRLLARSPAALMRRPQFTQRLQYVIAWKGSRLAEFVYRWPDWHVRSFNRNYVIAYRSSFYRQRTGKRKPLFVKIKADTDRLTVKADAVLI